MLPKQKKEERKFEVLTYIINLYVTDAAPVSSRSVNVLIGNSLSSATIRNIMCELEEEGYIKQPHTSAGRVPTDAGYRKYVDSVKEKLRFEKASAESLASEYSDRIRSIKDVIEKTSFLISRELHNTGIVMWPSIGDLYLKHLELIKVRAESVLAVLVTMTNAVKNYVIKISRDIEASEAEKVANYINSNYGEVSITRIAEELRNTIKSDESGGITDIAKIALETVDSMIEVDIENDVYWEGLQYFAREPESRDMDIASQILRAFSNKRNIASFMRRELPYSGLREYIGSENENESLKDCSFITGGYGFNGNTIGRIGVIGPTRMDYMKAIRTIHYLSELISVKLEEIA